MTCFHKFGPDGSCEPCDRKDRLDRRNETKDLDRLTADDWRWLDERYERAMKAIGVNDERRLHIT